MFEHRGVDRISRRVHRRIGQRGALPGLDADEIHVTAAAGEGGQEAEQGEREKA